MKPAIIAVSQDRCFLGPLVAKLGDKDVSWIHSRPGRAAFAAIDRHLPKLVIVDSGDGSDSQALSAVKQIKVQHPFIPVFLVAKYSNENFAIGAIKAGVDDYFKSPLCRKELLCGINRCLSTGGEYKSDNKKSKIETKMIGRSKIMTELKNHLARVSMADSTVLITGETGTGKELAATLIHENSARAKRPLVTVNCAALPDNLVESELFGFQKGAFTGAIATTQGRFQLAQGGTVFLDEIGDMTPIAQAKILRAIEDKHISPLGGTIPMPLDFRLIAATNQDPDAMRADGAFRDDLFYRLNVARCHMPSLRDRREDIPDLIELAINRLNLKFNRNIQGLKEDALELLYRYDWPGNVRELLNVLEGAFINLPDKIIDLADLPMHMKKRLEEHRNSSSCERKRIIAALLETNWNKSTAAAKLNWSRMTLYRKIAKHRIVEKRSSR